MFMASLGHAEDILERLPIGALEIMVIPDASVTMAKDLVPDLKAYPEYEGVFAHGPVPAVSRTYLLENKGHRILFDTGWGKGRAITGATLKHLQEAGISPASITDIVLTHMDHDHIGGLIENDQKVFPNATLWIATPEMEAWANGKDLHRPKSSIALAQDVLKTYAGKIRNFNYGEEILPDVTAVDARGHTPGHTAFDISSGNDKLTIAGDLVHIAPIQLPLPQLSTVYDNDPKLASQTRKRILGQTAKDHAILAGMHFPMISPVIERPEGGFMMREPRGL